MADIQEFCLRWNNHQSNLVSAFHDLRLGLDFVDVTLACDGRNLQAHKVVLSACSPFFRDILKTTPCKHPVIILRDISFFDLAALVEFMYQGEVRIGHEGLPSFLRTAEVLRIKGLAEDLSLRQKAIKRQLLPEANHPLVQTESNLSTVMANQESVVPASDDADVKLEETGNYASMLQKPALRDLSFDNEDLEESETLQPSLTLQSFARIQPLLPETTVDCPTEVLENPSEPANLDVMSLGPGTSRDPQSPHECPYCNRRICNLYALRRHIRDRHHNQNNVFPCDLCGRTYRTKNSLTTHRSVKHRPLPASSPTSLHVLRFQRKRDSLQPDPDHLYG